ncbi:4-fold beta flower protein [Micromonospora echinofusca]|uniref:4-fold beta flower protein n=1 Tax=Micromonospora echinofusca TaxID=47858 RepID=UPI0033CD5CD0
MSSLYTKNGRPLQVSGDSVYSRSGKYVGRISGGKVYDPSGRYAGTIVGDRVIYRSAESASISGPSVSAPRVGSAAASAVGSALWGDEPNFPD